MREEHHDLGEKMVLFFGPILSLLIFAFGNMVVRWVKSMGSDDFSPRKSCVTVLSEDSKFTDLTTIMCRLFLYLDF